MACPNQASSSSQNKRKTLANLQESSEVQYLGFRKSRDKVEVVDYGFADDDFHNLVKTGAVNAVVVTAFENQRKEMSCEHERKYFCYYCDECVVSEKHAYNLLDCCAVCNEDDATCKEVHEFLLSTYYKK